MYIEPKKINSFIFIVNYYYFYYFKLQENKVY